jgi:putative glycerol-1-phosphate prenyltransferase
MYKGRRTIFNQMASKKGQIAVLIDPEKSRDELYLTELIKKSAFAGVDYFFIGGSTVSVQDFKSTVSFVKNNSSIPVVIFPGAAHQVSEEADAILYLSLLSGRNAEYLIGQHVASALEIHQLDLEVIPTAYILIDGGNKSSVAYVSQTTPIPATQTGIAVKTAIAGVMQGKKIVFFDAGSGASSTVPNEILNEFYTYSNEITIVGGGVSDIETMEQFKKANANVIVIGNKLESNIDFLLDIANFNQLTN